MIQNAQNKQNVIQLGFTSTLTTCAILFYLCCIKYKKKDLESITNNIFGYTK